MKVVIAGGSGQLGTVLARSFVARNDDVCVLSRNPQQNSRANADDKWRRKVWDGRRVSDWAAEMDDADVVINLAGRSVNCRYNAQNRKEILDSRVDSVKAIGEALKQSSKRPRLWLQMSTATIYAHRFDKANDEYTGIIGGNEPDAPENWRFSIEVATAWERALDEAVLPSDVRKVKMRTSLVLSPDEGGIFDVLMGLVQKGLGGANGNGKQYVSWITDIDFVRAVDFIIEREQLSGVINICSPNPIPNADFMRVLRESAGVPFGLPAAKWMLEVGAIFLSTESELLLKSRRVVPQRLIDAGFHFTLPLWQEAAKDLFNRWRGARQP